jgi:hypothetical protein
MCKDSEILLKRARQKYISLELSKKLYFSQKESPLKDSYFGSMLCCETILQDGKKLTTSYCKQRWCFVCNRIRTARLITTYLPIFGDFKEPYFVTLTKKTVDAENLPSAIKSMGTAWRTIANRARKHQKDFKGVRKAECTIRPSGKYHYHYHLIVEGKANAEFIVSNWLELLGSDLATAQGQDIRAADLNSLKELFKYFTKLASKDGLYPLSRMDVIFRAMKGKRVFQSFGGVRAANEELENIESQEYEFLDEGEVNFWRWYESDWVNQNGELLTGYIPTDGLKERIFGDKTTDITSDSRAILQPIKVVNQ